MRPMNVMLALLMLLGAGIAGAASQTAFTTFFGAQATSGPLTGTETVLIIQGGVLKQAPISSVRGATVTAGSPFTVGNCVQAGAGNTIVTSATGCVLVPAAPFLTAN